MDLAQELRNAAQIARERDQLTALPRAMERAADRIAELEAALREIADLGDVDCDTAPNIAKRALQK